jgi:hypothetical protein
MAKSKSDSTTSAPKHSSKGEVSYGGETGRRGTSDQDQMMGDISTAASSTMGPRDYSRGYPPNGNEHLNKNFAKRGS